MVQPACTRSSPGTSSFWLLLSSSQDVSENQRLEGLKKRKKVNFCAYEGKAENVNSQCELAELGMGALSPGCCGGKGRTLLGPALAPSFLPFAVEFPARDVPSWGTNSVCVAGTQQHCQSGAGPGSASGDRGQSSFWGHGDTAGAGWEQELAATAPCQGHREVQPGSSSSRDTGGAPVWQ